MKEASRGAATASSGVLPAARRAERRDTDMDAGASSAWADAWTRMAAMRMGRGTMAAAGPRMETVACMGKGWGTGRRWGGMKAGREEMEGWGGRVKGAGYIWREIRLVKNWCQNAKDGSAM